MMTPKETNKDKTSILLMDYKDYRLYLKATLENLDRGGLGQLARSLGVSSTLISLIIKGEKNLTPEQALVYCEVHGFTEWETEYFTLMVDLERAGTTKLKSRATKKLQALKDQGHQLVRRVKFEKSLSEETATRFYSSWLYSGLRNFAVIESNPTAQDMATRFHIPLAQVKEILEFLINEGLLIGSDKGYEPGPRTTHLSSQSLLVNQQHRNWRLRAMEKMERRRESDLFYSCPMSLSHKDAEKIRNLLPSIIKQILEITGPSKSETVMCWNLDWFSY